MLGPISIQSPSRHYWYAAGRLRSVPFFGCWAQVRKKIRNYVDFTFSVTHGINIESISAQLPSHLQLELYSQLNKRMVEQVPPATRRH